MRYRLELDGRRLLAVQNVEADARAGSVLPRVDRDPNDPDREVTRCQVYCIKGGSLVLPEVTHINPVKFALETAAGLDVQYEFPSLRKRNKKPDDHRVEFELGKLVADAVRIIARATIEHQNGGMKAETKAECGEVFVELYKIWYASRFGSYDSERWLHEPYFAAMCTREPRMDFAAAAQCYGVWELNFRYPHAGEAQLKIAVSWVLDVLREMLIPFVPLERITKVLTQELITYAKEQAAGKGVTKH